MKYHWHPWTHSTLVTFAQRTGIIIRSPKLSIRCSLFWLCILGEVCRDRYKMYCAWVLKVNCKLLGMVHEREGGDRQWEIGRGEGRMSGRERLREREQKLAHRVWEVPWSVIYKLESQKNWWCDIVRVQRITGAGGVSPSSSGKSKLSPPLPFCAIWALSDLDDARSPGRGFFFTQLIQMLISSRIPLTDTVRNVFTHPLAQSDQHIELTITESSQR